MEEGTWREGVTWGWRKGRGDEGRDVRMEAGTRMEKETWIEEGTRLEEGTWMEGGRGGGRGTHPL